MINEISTPISPIDSELVDKVDEPEDEWEDVENSDIAYDKGTWSEVEGEELLCGECDEQPETLIQPKCFPEPKAPSQKEIDEHNLTHANYRSWCPHCVAGRRNNSPHKSMESSEPRNLPCLHVDDCFPKDEHDEEAQTVLVGVLEPANTTLACPVDMKGTEDEYGYKKLKEFVTFHGVRYLVCKSDQENALMAAVKVVVEKLRKEGIQIAFENYPVGESQSNGKIERRVQAVEDLLRTLRSALMSRLKVKLPMDHPISKWLIEHTASIMNRFVIGKDGQTAYQRLHGRRAHKKAVEFGERVFYYIPGNCGPRCR